MKASELNPQFVTDESGARVAVILSIAEYEEIADCLEDLDDAVEIERRRAEVGIPHEDVLRIVDEDCDVPD